MTTPRLPPREHGRIRRLQPRSECGSAVTLTLNERSGGVLNRAQYPSDVIALVVLWRLRYKLSLRDLPEMFALRGIVFSYEAVRDWEAKLTPALAEELRRRRRGQVGRSWYVDETYLKGHLEKLTFPEHTIWMEGRPAGFIARDRNGAAWFLRSRRALSRSRCQEGPAGCPERGRALGGFPRSVERGLAQAGRGAKDRGRTQAVGRDRHLQDAGSAGALQSL